MYHPGKSEIVGADYYTVHTAYEIYIKLQNTQYIPGDFM